MNHILRQRYIFLWRMRLSVVTQSFTAPCVGHAQYSSHVGRGCVCTCLSLHACWSGLAQSVIQVRPTGSGLMRIGSALSGSWPVVEAVCGAQGEKRNAAENTSSPSLETARDAAKCSENSDLSGHNDTAQCSGFLWGAVGQGFLKTHKTPKKSKR